MHKLPLYIAFLTLVNCTAAPRHVPPDIISVGYDFRKYSQLGFLFTADSYNGDYESIGLVSATVYPEANRVDIEQQFGSEWQEEKVSYEDALSAMYDLCVEMGADALTQMKIESATTTIFRNTNKPLERHGILISGYAIKRLGSFQR